MLTRQSLCCIISIIGIIPILNGENMSKQKALVYDIICNSPRHMNASEIYDLAKEKLPNISFGTVYRNLNVLVQDGDIMRIAIDKCPDRFDKNPMAHHHMICTKCGNVIDVFKDDSNDIREIEEHMGAQITEYIISMKCICKQCLQMD
ncbi:MAG: transcriptional repressor [Ruminococcaceae bacterium]|nr:transcriptional repressor [Oscillospiraceae bacterium]